MVQDDAIKHRRAKIWPSPDRASLIKAPQDEEILHLEQKDQKCPKQWQPVKRHAFPVAYCIAYVTLNIGDTKTEYQRKWYCQKFKFCHFGANQTLFIAPG
jgi:hypothetical protein